MWKWNTLKDLFNKLNELEYVILRNYETLKEEIDAGGDIDILCPKKSYVANEIHAYKRVLKDEAFNYFIMIGERKVPIDIREIGDGYYDEKWEQNMLKNRIKNKEYYIMDNENYKYSLLYHVLLHKFTIKESYINRLEKMFGTEIGNNDKTDNILGYYMRKKGYFIPIPVDNGVEFNKEKYIKICKIIESQENESGL